MNIGFLCSNSKSSLIQRLLRENKYVRKEPITIFTKSKYKQVFTEDEYTNVRIVRIDWQNNIEGSYKLHSLFVKYQVNIVLCLFDRIIDVVSNDFSKMKLVNLHPSLCRRSRV